MSVTEKICRLGSPAVCGAGLRVGAPEDPHEWCLLTSLYLEDLQHVKLHMLTTWHCCLNTVGTMHSLRCWSQFHADPEFCTCHQLTFCIRWTSWTAVALLFRKDYER